MRGTGAWLVATLAACSAAGAAPRTLTMEQRVRYEARIQEVLGRHRTGGGQRRIPPLDAVRKGVEDFFQMDAALRERWHRGSTAADLQEELQRLSACSRDPGLLREVYGALGDDPFAIAECVARPLLVRRRFADYFAWDREIHAAARARAERAAADARRADPTAVLRETASAFVVSSREAGSVLAAIEKLGRDEWLAAYRPVRSAPSAVAIAPTLHPVGSAPCRQDGFNEGPAWKGPVIWTGTEMWVWSGKVGGLYSPATDTWRSATRYGATGGLMGQARGVPVWAGSEVILWNGAGDGWRYAPARDEWTHIPYGGGSPSGRSWFSATWSGTEVVIWGGIYGTTYLGDGARYDLAAGTWRPVSMVGAPAPRYYHTAVWTGAELIVWGGNGAGGMLGDGGAYDPSTDAWRPVTLVNAPTARSGHTAVWSGSEMLVWGGVGVAGGRYQPSTDTWTPMSTTGAPPVASGHTAVWSGKYMIVWLPGGGATGGRYDPVADRWLSVDSGPASPGPRTDFGAVWTGAEMLVYGGLNASVDADGAIFLYEQDLDQWRPGSRGGVIENKDRSWHTSVWTGVEMIVWGGQWAAAINTGGRYVAAFDTWQPTSTGTNVPPGDVLQAAVWTGTEMIVHGFSRGAYDPTTDTWRPTPVGPVDGREAVAVWTGSEMIFWSGWDGGNSTNAGARFDPSSNIWTPMSTVGAPAPREQSKGVWTGSRMLVYGGLAGSSFADGGLYDPVTDTWATFSGSPIPSYRFQHTMVWTGSQAIVWGGLSGGASNTGAAYDPVSGIWTPTPVSLTTPAPRAQHTAVWTGTEMIVWGGRDDGGYPYGDGGRLDWAAGTWTPVAAIEAPYERYDHSSEWTGFEMVIFGGREPDHGRYDPLADAWMKRWREGNAVGDDVLAGKGAAPGLAPYTTGIRGYRVDGQLTPTLLEAFPGLAGYGVKVASGDVLAGGHAEVVAAPGPGPSWGPRVRGFDRDGLPRPELDLLAYGTGGYGANVGTGSIDWGVKALTGPGPSPVFGPQVRAFRAEQTGGTPVYKVNFYAYGTLRYGVHAKGGAVDGDAFDEILTSPGPGAVFGPHVRGWDYDASSIAAIPGISFFAYGTLKYGAEVGAGDVEGDGFDEILTGPGPSAAFGAHLRGFDYDGTVLRAKATINVFAFTGSRSGANVVAGDLDGDGIAEIACGAGPDGAFGSRMTAFQHDAGPLVPIAALGLDVFGLAYGVRVSAGSHGY